MCNEDDVEIEFDYSNFLVASCGKKWTFKDLFTEIAPSFGIKLKQHNGGAMHTEEHSFDKAFSSLACAHSDEENFVELMKLARQYRVSALKISMPYALDKNQIASIERRALVSISPTLDNDDLLVSILPSM